MQHFASVLLFLPAAKNWSSQIKIIFNFSFPGRAVAFVLMEKIGRKYTFMGSIGVGCVCMFVSIHDNAVSRKIMYCIGKVNLGEVRLDLL